MHKNSLTALVLLILTTLGSSAQSMLPCARPYEIRNQNLKNKVPSFLQHVHGLSDQCSKGRIARYKHESAKTTINSELSQRLMEEYDQHYYDIHMTTLMQDTFFSGDASFRATALSSLDTVCFQMAASVVIDSVFINSQVANYQRIGDDVLILLPSAISAGSDFEVRAKYVGQYETNYFFAGGMTKTQSWISNDIMIASFSSPYFMRRWLPAKEILHDKIDSVDISIETELGLTAGSNGLRTGIDTVGTRTIHHWKTRYPTDYYLISIAVGEYDEYISYAYPSALNGDSVLMQNFICSTSYNPTFEQSLFPYTDTMLEEFSDMFGLYPFASEKYGNCLVGAPGGMEHQTMTSIGVPSLFVFTHELAHQWFGDYVTCGSLQDISINEGFASYGEVLTVETFDFPGLTVRDYLQDIHTYVKSEPDGSVYCVDTTDPNRIFDARLTYNKGSAVLGTLRFILGDSLFFGGVTDFLQKHAYGTATFQDLKADLESYTGVNLDDYFAQWIYGEGYPRIFAKYAQHDSTVYLKLSQTSTAPNSVSFFKGPIEIELRSATDTVRKVLDWHTQDQLFSMTYAQPLTDIEINPDLDIVCRIQYVLEDTTLDIDPVDAALPFSIYPNPAHDYVQVEGIKLTPAVTKVYNSLGAIIRVQILGDRIQLPQDLAPGIYFLQVGESVASFSTY